MFKRSRKLKEKRKRRGKQEKIFKNRLKNREENEIEEKKGRDFLKMQLKN